VNMAKGASGPPRPVRVTVEADAEGEEQFSVTVGPFVSEMDEAERLREKHETKRLLYVALTRARDRLYLASALKDGAMVPGRGSLAEVFPQSMKDLFARAGACASADSTTRVMWRTGKIRIDAPDFQWHVCRQAPLTEIGE
jgi:UvrD-like helicase C-terminal domain